MHVKYCKHMSGVRQAVSSCIPSSLETCVVAQGTPRHVPTEFYGRDIRRSGSILSYCSALQNTLAFSATSAQGAAVHTQMTGGAAKLALINHNVEWFSET